jgi:HD-GYP domain-containing protein (c-di-GMP phosphodiesterase class II)
VRHHHERFDGSGYPDGLRGQAIPLGARVIAVADAFDAITSTRPYRAARSKQEALAEIKRGAGRQFDPAVVGAFVGLMEERTATPPGSEPDRG